jgi:hypothetical protein
MEVKSLRFPLSEGTEEVLAELIRLDEIAAEFATGEAAARETLRKLQAERVGALVKSQGASSAGTERAVEMQAARDRILDSQSAIEACQVKRSELLPRILLSMKADKAARVKELREEVNKLCTEEAELKRKFIVALAAAAVAQMEYMGWWNRIKKSGPGLNGGKDAEGQRFFESEIDRLCAESGLSAGHKPLSDRIKIGESYIETFREPISAEDIQAAIEAVRQARAKG